MARRKKGMKGRGSVFQRKSDGRWVAQFLVEETGKQKQLYAATEAEAYKKIDKALREQEQGILATGPQQKLKDYLNWWLEDFRKTVRPLRTSSYVRYRGLLDNHILPELGEIQLRKLTPLRIQTFYNNKLKDKQSSSSVHSMHKVLHGGLKQAVKLRYLSNNPADGASLPADEPQREGQSLTLEQAQHLLTVVRGHRLEAFIALTLTTGMRHGELTALRWSAIKFGTGTEIGSISVQRTAGFIAKHGFVENEPKTKKSERVLPLIPAVARVLEIHRCNQEEIKRKAGLRWEEHELVFTTKTGNYVHSNITRDAFYRLLKKANTIPDVSGNMLNLPPVHIHDLRHTASTLWQSLGISEKVAQSWLGHTSLEMTRNVYTHLLPSMQREAAERINALFQAIPEE